MCINLSAQTHSTPKPKPKLTFAQKIIKFSKLTYAFKYKNGTLIPLPVIAYSPETKLALGAALYFNFRFKSNDSTTNLSSLNMGTIFTINGQIVIVPRWNFYLGKDKYRFSGDLSYRKYPDDFYGIGNNTLASNRERYTAQYLQFRPRFTPRISKNLYVGGQYRLEYTYQQQNLDSGLLFNANIPGTKGYFVSGLGAVVEYDTRDNNQFPFYGMFLTWSNLIFSKGFGSQWEYNNVKIDGRWYFNPWGSHVIAVQAYGEINIGNVPFRLMSELGGDEMMRGYYKGRYRDHNMVSAQVEYRFPIWWRFIGVAFVGTGDVFDKPKDLSLNLLKVSGGGGLRFTLDARERINMRVDFAFGRFNQHGVYFGIGEAF